MAKERLDKILVNLGLFESREKAQAVIMAGGILVNGKVHWKPGTKFPPEDLQIEIVSDPIPYVSRGGLKLEKAITEFGLSIEEKKCLDVGASTGGFTDCLLKHGAAKVIALDVGYGQLDWSLRQDSRVVVMEKTNVRHLDPADLPFLPDIITVDTSFISITKFLSKLSEFLPFQGELITLIKPQFEAGPDQVGKGGIVRDQEVQLQALYLVLENSVGAGFNLLGLTYSPIKGSKGNIEFLAYFVKDESPIFNSKWQKMAKEIVSQAQQDL